MAQDSLLNLTIKLEGFKAKDQISLQLDDKKYALSGERQETQTKLSIDDPTPGAVMFKSRFVSFWFEPGEQTLIISKSNFLKGTRLQGSKSQNLSNQLRAAEADEKVQIIEKNLKHPVIESYMATSSKNIPEMDRSRLMALMPKSIDDFSKYNARGIRIDKSEVVKKGDDIFDFVASTIDDKVTDTKALRGSYILLDFSATGCGPCWTAYPMIKKDIVEKSNIKVLTIVQDYAHEGWANIAKNRDIQFSWPILWKAENKKEIFEKYGIKGWPYYALISPEGEILETLFSGNHNRLMKMLERNNALD